MSNMIIIPLASDVMYTISVVKLLCPQVFYYDHDKEVFLWESQSLPHTTWRYSTCLIGIITLRAHSIAPPLIPMNTHTYYIHIQTYWSEHVLYNVTILFSIFCFFYTRFFLTWSITLLGIICHFHSFSPKLIPSTPVKTKKKNKNKKQLKTKWFWQSTINTTLSEACF